MVDMIMPLDFWTVLVEITFGSFLLALLGLFLLFYIIMGVFGKMSPYSVMMYEMMFFVAMSIGYGLSLYMVLMSIMILTWFAYEFTNLIDSKMKQY